MINSMTKTVATTTNSTPGNSTTATMESITTADEFMLVVNIMNTTVSFQVYVSRS